MRNDSEGAQKSPSGPSPALNGSSPSIHKNGLNGTGQFLATNGTSGTPFAGYPNDKSTFYGHDREEVARILIQGLHDLGYPGAATSLSNESGFDLESPHASAFRMAVMNGEWADAEHFLTNGRVTAADQEEDSFAHPNGHGSIARNSVVSSSRTRDSIALNRDSSMAELLFLVRQQKYLELLEQRDIPAALLVLQQELHPLHQEQRQLHALSSLIMCQSAEDLRSQAGWDGAQGESRKLLLSDLSRAISPSVMIPEHRLATLFNQLKESQMHDCLYHNTPQLPSLYTSHACGRDTFPLELHAELDQHTHEVWFCAFSNDGTRLATASKDKSVIIWDTKTFRSKFVLKEHRQAVAYVAWSPDDTRLVSCSQDFEARLWDTQTGRCVKVLKHHEEPVSTAAWAPDGKSFVTGSLDKERPLCIWPRDPTSSNPSPLHTFDGCDRVEGCALAALTPASAALQASVKPADLLEQADTAQVRLVAFCVDKTVHVFDYLRREKLRQITLDYPITCISLSRNGQEMLMNLNQCGEIRIVGVEDGVVRQKFSGQQQGEFMVRSCLGGATEGFVVSGGEDGRIRVWHRHSGRMIEDLQGHRPSCVNAVNWNKAAPHMFASVSDDKKVRIWAAPHPNMSQSQVLQHNRRSYNNIHVQMHDEENIDILDDNPWEESAKPDSFDYRDSLDARPLRR